jgi:predicted aspartyl protease
MTIDTKCGFDNNPANGVSGQQALVAHGPTLLVDIGFDPSYTAQAAAGAPIAGLRGVRALVDTGATECCIDSLVAAQLALPAVDQRPVSGVHGQRLATFYLAQIHIPALAFTMYGTFAGVDLLAGGQQHFALIGRTFLRDFNMVYEGITGTVTLSRG